MYAWQPTLHEKRTGGQISCVPNFTKLTWIIYELSLFSNFLNKNSSKLRRCLIQPVNYLWNSCMFCTFTMVYCITKIIFGWMVWYRIFYQQNGYFDICYIAITSISATSQEILEVRPLKWNMVNILWSWEGTVQNVLRSQES